MESRKYIFENGVMKLNPSYNKTQATPSTVADPKKALAIVSTPADVIDASNLQEQKTGRPMQLSEATTASMDILQDGEFLDKFKAKNPLDGGELLDGLTTYFAKYEIPIGMINKLLALTEYKLNFIIDDSGSMSSETDALIKDATLQMQQKLSGRSGRMTRWEEAEDRLHTMIDMLAYIPTNDIVINFLNRDDRVVLAHTGKTTQQFSDEAHKQISKAFKHGPQGNTPAYGKLKQAFAQSTTSTMHYFFTDGEPSDASTNDVCTLVKNRSNPGMCPLTFVSCTDKNADWMKEIEEAAPFVSELDDFKAERDEVLHDQGATFPFSRGFWLLCHLAAAINPDDLDALDESIPFSKMTMDNLLGRKLTADEYKQYFNGNPNARQYAGLYSEFAREDVSARQIIANRSKPMVMPSMYSGFFNYGDKSAAAVAMTIEDAPPPYTP